MPQASKDTYFLEIGQSHRRGTIYFFELLHLQKTIKQDVLPSKDRNIVSWPEDLDQAAVPA